MRINKIMVVTTVVTYLLQTMRCPKVFYTIMHKGHLNENGNFNFVVNKSLNATFSIMAVNSVTGLPLWHNNLISTVDLNIGRQQFISITAATLKM